MPRRGGLLKPVKENNHQPMEMPMRKFMINEEGLSGPANYKKAVERFLKTGGLPRAKGLETIGRVETSPPVRAGAFTWSRGLPRRARGGSTPNGPTFWDLGGCSGH